MSRDAYDRHATADRLDARARDLARTLARVRTRRRTRAARLACLAREVATLDA